MTKFERAFQFTFRNEDNDGKPGTDDLVNDPDDPGGPTKWGVTLPTLSDWRGVECTMSDLAAMTIEEAQAIYEHRYWEPLGCARLPDAVATALFDSGVLYGPTISAKLAQETANTLAEGTSERLRVDGILGPLSGALIASYDESTFLVHYTQNLLTRIQALVDKKPKLSKFQRGWEKRAKKLLTLVPTRPSPENGKT